MFNTTLADEYLAAMRSMGLTIDVLEQLVQNAVAASLLPKAESRAMSLAFREECVELSALHGL